MSNPYPDLVRMWIDQPSGLQPFHALHGTNVLACPEDGRHKVFFLSGNIHSQQIPSLCLSLGWRPEPSTSQQEIPCQA